MIYPRLFLSLWLALLTLRMVPELKGIVSCQAYKCSVLNESYPHRHISVLSVVATDLKRSVYVFHCVVSHSQGYVPLKHQLGRKLSKHWKYLSRRKE